MVKPAFMLTFTGAEENMPGVTSILLLAAVAASELVFLNIAYFTSASGSLKKALINGGAAMKRTIKA